MMNWPKELSQVIEYLQTHPVELPTGSGDGRRDSGDKIKLKAIRFIF